MSDRGSRGGRVGKARIRALAFLWHAPYAGPTGGQQSFIAAGAPPGNGCAPDTRSATETDRNDLLVEADRGQVSHAAGDDGRLSGAFTAGVDLDGAARQDQRR